MMSVWTYAHMLQYISSRVEGHHLPDTDLRAQAGTLALLPSSPPLAVVTADTRSSLSLGKPIFSGRHPGSSQAAQAVLNTYRARGDTLCSSPSCFPLCPCSQEPASCRRVGSTHIRTRNLCRLSQSPSHFPHPALKTRKATSALVHMVLLELRPASII